MINWAAIEPGVQALFAQLAGVPAEWATREEGFISDTTLGVLRIEVLSNVPYGLSAERTTAWTEDVPADPEADPPTEATYAEGTETSHQLHRVTLRVECKTISDAVATSARQRLETLRGALVRRSAQTALKALGMGFARSLALTPLPLSADNRWTSRAAIDLRFNIVGMDVDPERIVDVRRVIITPIIDGETLPDLDFETGEQVTP